MTSSEFKNFLQQLAPLSNPTLRCLGMMALVNGRSGKDVKLQAAPPGREAGLVIPLGLDYAPIGVHLPPGLSRAAQTVIDRIVDYVKNLGSPEKPIGLLDSGFHGEFLRRHLMARLEGRCEYYNYIFHLIRGNGPEENFIDQDYACYVSLSHPSAYHRMARYVKQHSRALTPLVLPFAQGPTADLTMEVSFGAQKPIVVLQYPGAGTQRMRPVWEALMASYERPKVEFNEVFFNRRFIEALDPRHQASGLHYGAARFPLEAIQDYYGGVISSMDHFQWLQFHHPVSTSWLGALQDCSVVYLYRDPRDVMTSCYNVLANDGVREDFGDLQRMSPEEAFLKLIEGFDYIHPARGYVCKVPSLEFMATNFAAIQHYPNIYGLRFEDIRYRPEEAYADLLRWLGLAEVSFVANPSAVIASHVAKGTFKAQSGGKVSEGQEKSRGVFRPGGKMMTHSMRKGVAGDWKNYFTPTVKKKFKEVAGESLVAMGYEQNLDW